MVGKLGALKIRWESRLAAGGKSDNWLPLSRPCLWLVKEFASSFAGLPGWPTAMARGTCYFYSARYLLYRAPLQRRASCFHLLLPLLFAAVCRWRRTRHDEQRGTAAFIAHLAASAALPGGCPAPENSVRQAMAAEPSCRVNSHRRLPSSRQPHGIAHGND